MSSSEPIATPAASQGNILLIDAGDDLRSLLPPGPGAGVVYQDSAGADWAALPGAPFALALLDVAVSGAGDLPVLRHLREVWPRLKVIVLSSGRNPIAFCALLRQKAFSLPTRPLLKARLQDAVELALQAPAGWEDDVELLSGSQRWIQLRVACEIHAAERAAILFRELAVDAASEDVEEFATACREMLMNAIEHGGHYDPAQSVFVNYVISDLALVFYLRDPGPGFSFRNLPHAAISNSDGSLEHAGVREQLGIRPGGFGILLARNLVDELIYSERGNEVILIKHRKPAGSS